MIARPKCKRKPAPQFGLPGWRERLQQQLFIEDTPNAQLIHLLADPWLGPEAKERGLVLPDANNAPGEPLPL